MLAFNPETVDMTAARDFRSWAETAVISPTGPISLGWVASDLNPAGVVGETQLAAKGGLTAEHMGAGFNGLLQQVRGLTLDGYAPVVGPS